MVVSAVFVAACGASPATVLPGTPSAQGPVDISRPARADELAERTIGNGVTLTPFGQLDPFEGTVPLTDDDATISLTACRALGSGSWRFDGRIDVEQPHERSSMEVVLGWLVTSDTGPFNDLGFAADVRGSGGDFTVMVDQRASALDEFVHDPVGALFDRPCAAYVADSPVPMLTTFAYVGPTGDRVPGPRPAPNGCYLPTPAWPASQPPDVAGWLTSAEFDAWFDIVDPTFRPYTPGSIGPMTIGVGTTPITVPARTPGSSCGVLLAASGGPQASGPGAQATGCLALVDLSSAGIAARVDFIAGELVAWNDGWDAAFRPQSTVMAAAAVLDDGHAIFDSTISSEPGTRLPLADDVTIDCPPERGFDPFDRTSMYIGSSVDVTIDVQTIEVSSVTCENYFAG